MNVRDATELFVREEGSFGVSEKINEIRMDFYQKKKDNYERRFQNIVLKTKMNTMHIFLEFIIRCVYSRSYHNYDNIFFNKT